VAGQLHGQSVCVPAASLDEIVARIDHWTMVDENSTGHWRLHDDYSEPVTIILRPRSGLIRGTRRLAHLVRLLPGQAQGIQLSAQCGEKLTILETETLSAGAGMPCERCLLETPVSVDSVW
jgi:hypothetical protein